MTTIPTVSYSEVVLRKAQIPNTPDNGRKQKSYILAHIRIFPTVTGSIIPTVAYSYIAPIMARVPRYSHQWQEAKKPCIGTYLYIYDNRRNNSNLSKVFMCGLANAANFKNNKLPILARISKYSL